jgi:hypothetical protein
MTKLLLVYCLILLLVLIDRSVKENILPLVLILLGIVSFSLIYAKIADRYIAKMITIKVTKENIPAIEAIIKQKTGRNHMVLEQEQMTFFYNKKYQDWLTNRIMLEPEGDCYLLHTPICYQSLFFDYQIQS